jgi:hypothetical protein
MTYELIAYPEQAILLIQTWWRRVIERKAILSQLSSFTRRSREFLRRVILIQRSFRAAQMKGRLDLSPHVPRAPPPSLANTPLTRTCEENFHMKGDDLDLDALVIRGS